MTTPVRLAAFAAAVVAVFALAFGLGRAVGPWDAPAPTHSEEEVHGHDQ